jgi:hypothetical protein
MKETLVQQSSDPPVMMLDVECVERYLDELAVVLSKTSVKEAGGPAGATGSAGAASAAGAPPARPRN